MLFSKNTQAPYVCAVQSKFGLWCKFGSGDGGGGGSMMLVNNCEQTPLKLAQIYKAG